MLTALYGETSTSIDRFAIKSIIFNGTNMTTLKNWFLGLSGNLMSGNLLRFDLWFVYSTRGKLFFDSLDIQNHYNGGINYKPGRYSVNQAYLCVTSKDLSASQWVSQSVSESVSESVSQWVSQSVSESVSELISESVSQSANRSVSQSVNHSVSESVR